MVGWLTISRWFVLTCLILVLGACNVISAQLSKSDNNDIRGARAVKSALMASEEINAAPLRVTKRGNQIYLSGFVESEAEKLEAEAITEKLYPEASISNKIQMR